MNNQRNSDSEAYVDADVRNAYRNSAVELTSASLNHRILKRARQAAEGGSRKPGTESWVRPLAFAAMVVLSLTAILQFKEPRFEEIDPGFPSVANDGQPDQSEVRASDLVDAVESTGQRLRQLNTEAESLDSNNRPMPAANPPSRSNPDSSGRAGDAVSVHCEPESRTSADSWWQCIQALRDEGMADAARGELALFRTAHPSFDTN